MDTLSMNQANSFCAIQSNLYAFFRNSIAQEKTVAGKIEKQPGTRVEFVEPQRKKQESTPLPRINSSVPIFFGDKSQ